MNIAKRIRLSFCGSYLLPNNFITKIILSKDLIQKNLNIVTDVIIKMHVDRGIFAHNGTNCHKILIHPVKVFLLIPDVTIHLFFKGFQFIVFQFLLSFLNSLCYKRIPTQVNFLGIIGTTGKRWVNIYQINFYPLFLQISTHRHTFAMNNHVV